MQLFRAASEIQSDGRPASVAIGVFDGVHIGHQEVISRAVAEARARNGISIVITFDAHPANILAPERAPRLIQSLGHRLHEIGKLGVDAVVALEFTKAFSLISGEDFVSELARNLAPLRFIAVGESFTFGHKRSGNVGTLRSWGAAHGCQVHAVPPVLAGGEPVSSTRIRAAIREGALQTLPPLLGRPYSVRSIVQQGDQLGRKIGFPTANLDVRGLELPPFGVYAGEAVHEGGVSRAVANLGVRPSVSAEPTPRLEVHLLDFQEDLYAQPLEFVPRVKLRPEQKFDSVDALKAQIAQDVASARSALAS